MKVCFISTYPPIQCGVAHYTEKLVRSFRNVGCPSEVSVFTDRITQNDPRYAFRIVKEVIRNKPSIVHFQHEYLMYGFYGVPLLLALLILRLLRYPIVTTLHTVIPICVMQQSFFRRYGLSFFPIWMKKVAIVIFTRLICQLSCLTTVHTRRCKTVLLNEYHIREWKITIIPHGLDNVAGIPQNEAKHLLGLDKRQVMLCLGFIKPDKGFENAINALKSPDFCDYVLIIAGTIPFRHTLSEEHYVEYLHRLGSSLDLKERVIFIEHFLSDYEIRVLLSASDLVYLPYKLDTCGASGIYCLARSHKKRIMTSGISRFNENHDCDWDSVANALLSLYADLV